MSKKLMIAAAALAMAALPAVASAAPHRVVEAAHSQVSTDDGLTRQWRCCGEPPPLWPRTRV